MNQMPVLPTGEELAREELEELLAPYWLDPTVDYPSPHYLLEYRGVGFSPLGGIQALSGQKKNGKTFVLAQMISAILGHESERVGAFLNGLRLNEETLAWLGHEPSVLYVDTEMEQLNSAKVLKRVHWLCGWDMKKQYDRFRVLWLRQVQKNDDLKAFELRYKLIKSAIEYMQPTAVFIDGIRDVIGDFNNNEEASALVTDLMSVATQNNCCIWNVLHANPRPQNDDESKMRGHLGTELGNKVSDTFVSIKKKDPETGRVTFTVKQQDARGKDVDDWKFEIVDDAGKELGVPRIMEPSIGSEPTAKSKNDDTEWMTSAIRGAINPPSSCSYSELCNRLKANEGIGTTRVREWIRKSLSLEIIDRDVCGRYTFNENKANSNENDEMPF